MAKAKSEAATKPKSQLVREAIEKLVGEKRDVTTAAILALLQDAGLKDAKPMDIYQSTAWKELREKEKSGAALIPASKAAEAPTSSPQANSGITKTEAIRHAFEMLGSDAKPAAVLEFVKNMYGLEPSSQLVSNYKQRVSKKGELKRSPGRPPKATTITSAPAPRPAKASAGDISLEDLRSVKELVDRMGADKVRELASVLA